MFRFVAKCPNGHLTEQCYGEGILRGILDDKRLRLWCIGCDSRWDASLEEMEELSRRLDGR